MAWPIPPPLAEGTPWPPADLIKRNLRYEHLFKLYNGNHDELFRATLKYPTDWRIIPLKLGKVIAKVLSSWLWRQGFRVQFPPGTDEATKENINRLIEETDLLRTVRRLKRLNTFRGDGYLSASYSEFDLRASEFGVVIDAPHPATIYPIFEPGNPEKLQALAHYWTEKVKEVDGEKEFLVMELFMPSRWVKRRYLIEQGQITELLEETVRDVNIPVTTMVHIPNGEPDQGWYGVSDVGEIEEFILESVDTLTRWKRAVTVKDSPHVIVPDSACTRDEEGNRVVRLSECIVKTDPSDKYETLEWNVELGDTRELLKFLREIMFVLSGVAETALGGGIEGTEAESGKALMLRMAMTLFKTEEEKPTWERAIANILYAAQHLEVAKGAPYTPTWVTIRIPDTMPRTPKEVLEAVLPARDAGLMEDEAAFAELNPTVDPETIPAILDRIRSKRQAAQPAQPISSLRERALARLNGGNPNAP